MKFELDNIQKEEIRNLHKMCKDRRYADKLKSLLLLDKGFSCEDVGEMLLLDDDTIRIYRTEYLNSGAKKLIQNNQKGRVSYLTDEQLKELETHLEIHTYADSKGISVWIKDEFNVEYSANGLTVLLNRLGFVFKKPVLTPCKANPEKQKEFVEKYIDIKSNLSPDDEIYFVDGVHPQHNSIASFGWIKKGKTKQLKTNNGRKRTNINGALNIRTQDVIYVEDERINAQTMIALLNLILKQQKNGKIHIVLDNAKYYHAQIVKDFLLENDRIALHFMPPYSPNLNVIERLWKILKKMVVYNKFYLKFSDFQNEVNNFFKNKVWQNEKFKKTLVDNFQIIEPDFSGSYMN